MDLWILVVCTLFVPGIIGITTYEDDEQKREKTDFLEQWRHAATDIRTTRQQQEPLTVYSRKTKKPPQEAYSQVRRQGVDPDPEEWSDYQSQYKRTGYPDRYHSQSGSRYYREPLTTTTTTTSTPKPQRITCPYRAATGLFPYPGDCSKFIQCWAGRVHVQSCGPGTLFNPKIGVCDHAHMVQCDPPEVTTTKPAPLSSQRDLRTKITEAKCPYPDATGAFEYPGDCSVFINCWKGRAFVQPCAPGTLFSPETHECDHAQKVRCGAGRRTEAVEREEVYRRLDEIEPISTSNNEVFYSPMSGQTVRLRGSNPWEGFVEICWEEACGVVCDDPHGWLMAEAEVICQEMGYIRGVQRVFQGMSELQIDVQDYEIAIDSVHCVGHEQSIFDCDVSWGNNANLRRQLVGVSCVPDYAVRCGHGDVPFGDKCYHFFLDERDHLGRQDARSACSKWGGTLAQIHTQAENDFVSAWLNWLANDTNAASLNTIHTDGFGIKYYGRDRWLWEETQKKIEFQNWWPGWITNVSAMARGKVDPPPLKPYPAASCVVLTRTFPCVNSPENCLANYYFWDIADCNNDKYGFVCEKSQRDVDCVRGNGANYQGTANVSQSGTACMNWDSVYLASVRRKFPWLNSRDLIGHNYCRNPDGEKCPWCFIAPDRADFCEIPECSSRILRQNSVYDVAACETNQFQCAPDECINALWVCDGEKDCSNGADERNCPMYLDEFRREPDHRLEGYDMEKWMYSNDASCARRCLQSKDFDCFSFSYNSESSTCILSNSNRGLSGSLAERSGWVYYESTARALNCSQEPGSELYRCNNGKCINQTQLCDFRDDCGDQSDEKDCANEEDNVGFDIRLLAGNSSNQGVLQVKVYGKWGFVCDDMFSLTDAQVACRELGYDLGAVSVLPSSQFNLPLPPSDPKNNRVATIPVLMDDVQCIGHERSLAQCQFPGWGISDCNNEEMVGIVCRTPGMECPQDNWQCGNGNCVRTSFLCDDIDDCGDNSDEDPSSCQAPFDVRLVDGPTYLQGRLEIRYKGVWGTVCDDSFGDDDAQVICRMLGYEGPAKALKDSHYGSGVGPIWLDEVRCLGVESHLFECTLQPWGRHNCKHNEDVGVKCEPTHMAPRRAAVDSSAPPAPLSLTKVQLDCHCGTRTVEDIAQKPAGRAQKIAGGSMTEPGAYPWQVAIRVRSLNQPVHWCSGAIISPFHVLTAAHCVRDLPEDAYIVRAGDYDMESPDEMEQEFAVEKIYMHEQFGKGTILNNDLALIQLKPQHQQSPTSTRQRSRPRGILFTNHTRSICLPDERLPFFPGMNVTISGWGSTGSSGNGFTRYLRSAVVPLLSKNTCRSPAVYGDKITEGMICAGYLEGGIDSCQGDSGGPLVAYLDHRYTLVGITSWGYGCGRANKPGVYTWIPRYIPWIREKVAKYASTITCDR